MTTEYPDYEGEPDVEFCNLDPAPMQTVIQSYIHSIICAVGLIGNVLVIVTYAFYKRTKTMTDIYLFNMALSDLLFVVALPLIVHNESHGWSMGSMACKMLQGAYSINLYSGMLLLACVSGDRYVAIVQARRSFGARSKALIYSRLICLAIWVLATALSLPTVIYSEGFEELDLGTGAVTVNCQLHFNGNKTAKLMKVLLPSLQVSIGFALPLLVMMLCYSSIVYTLLGTQSGHKHKAIRVILVVVVVFIICHLPYNTALLTHTLSLFKERGCRAEKIKLRVLAVTKSVAYLHCCLNPFLYAFIGAKFRNHFQKALNDLWCLGRRYIYSGRTSCGTSDMYVSAHKSSDGASNDNGSSFTA
ncbi:C-C chemokine receptor type 6 [Lampris incognitus]|uniref:C-C chemokine receptor type 6 n=1 Tax=Lampris incognitus TaxID=2546036 RepID=UPI0024B55240|nr:C-C chemokine receptor type 6 [Lampris incognitus]